MTFSLSSRVVTRRNCSALPNNRSTRFRSRYLSAYHDYRSGSRGWSWGCSDSRPAPSTIPSAGPRRTSCPRPPRPPPAPGPGSDRAVGRGTSLKLVMPLACGFPRGPDKTPVTLWIARQELGFVGACKGLRRCLRHRDQFPPNPERTSTRKHLENQPFSTVKAA